MDEQAKKYVVLKDTVLPREKGGMETHEAGKELTGEYYEQFADAGALRRVAPPGPPSEESTAGTSRPQALAQETREPLAPLDIVDDRTMAQKVADGDATREELEVMTKDDLQVLAPEGAKGTKAKLITAILGE